jgi:hypothetical protein
MTTFKPEISIEYRAQMRAVAETLDEFLNGKNTPKHKRQTGFCVLMFPFGDPTGNPHRDRINYISNANRQDMIIAMKELISRFEGRHIEEQPGHIPGVKQ